MGNGEAKSSHSMSKLTDAEVGALQAAVNRGEVKGRLTEDVVVKVRNFLKLHQQGAYFKK